MSPLALPIRVGPDGRLGRGEGDEVLVEFIGVLAATTAGTWPHAPWLGLHELFARANLGLREQPAIADAIDLAFRQLGVSDVVVQSVRTAPQRDLGERRFEVTLLRSGRPVHGTVTG
jgi:hypothetical protein